MSAFSELYDKLTRAQARAEKAERERDDAVRDMWGAVERAKKAEATITRARKVAAGLRAKPKERCCYAYKWTADELEAALKP